MSLYNTRCICVRARELSRGWLNYLILYLYKSNEREDRQHLRPIIISPIDASLHYQAPIHRHISPHLYTTINKNLQFFKYTKLKKIVALVRRKTISKTTTMSSSSPISLASLSDKYMITWVCVCVSAWCVSLYMYNVSVRWTSPEWNNIDDTLYLQSARGVEHNTTPPLFWSFASVAAAADAVSSFSIWPRRRWPSCRRSRWRCTCRPPRCRSWAPRTTPSTADRGAEKRCDVVMDVKDTGDKAIGIYIYIGIGVGDRAFKRLCERAFRWDTDGLFFLSSSLFGWSGRRDFTSVGMRDELAAGFMRALRF